MLETLERCPVCDSSKHHHYLDVMGHDDGAYRLCEICGAAFLTPRMDDEELYDFYASGKYRELINSRSIGPGVSTTQHADRAAYIVELLEKSKFGSHLDIGCASGELMRAISKSRPGIYSMGVDPTTADREMNVVGTLEEVEREFDLITIIQTLEHINNPVKMMGMIRDRLSSSGAVMVEVPNRRADMIAFIPPQHVIAYDERSLLALMAGFTAQMVMLHGYPYMSPLDRSVLVVARK